MKPSILAVAVTLAPLLALQSACSHQPGVIATAPNSDSGQALPFENTSDGRGFFPTASLPTAGIPAGALLHVRLESSFSSAAAHAGDQFQGTLNEPAGLNGQSLAAGASVTGTILAAQPSSGREPGLLRLALTSITIHGKSFPVQTSSIFVKGGSTPGSVRLTAASSGNMKGRHLGGGQDVGFSAGREITFRLIQPVPVQN